MVNSGALELDLGQLIGEQGGETFVVAIADKLAQVGDKVCPRME